MKQLDTRISFLPELNDATQYSTVYWEDKPVATLCRRMVMAPKSEPTWQLYATDGALLHKVYLPGSYASLARRVQQVLITAELIKE